MRFPFFLPVLAFLCLCLSTSVAAPAPGEQALANSIRPVDATQLSAPSGARKAYVARRALQASETSATLEFEVVLKMRSFSDLRTRLAQHQRFSPQQMAANYHPLPTNAKAVSGWLVRNGFTITKTDPQNLAIFAQGTVEQIQKVMGVEFARVEFENQEYTSAITAPNVPAVIAPYILGINGLQPHITLRKSIKLKRSSLSDPNPPYTPSQIAAAYDTTELYNSGITGTGQTTAVVIDTFPNTSDLETFWSLCGISQSLSNISLIQVVPGTLPAASGEETLDTQWASAIAPGSKVRVYAATSLEFTDIDQCYAQVYNDAINHPEYGIHQMTLSYGAPENMVSTSQLDTDAQYFANLASAGVTVFASSGDQGANPDPTFGGSLGLSPETPSSDPSVTGVGGTALYLDGNNAPNGEVVWNNSHGSTGGGVSTYFSRPVWQTGNGVPAGLTRVVPDIAAAGDPVTGGLVILNGLTYQYGGTSWSSPTWAGFCALFNQKRANGGASPLGALNPYLYPLIGTANFQDITSGNNTFNGLVGFQAAKGYDLCTGLGTPHVSLLAQSLSGSSSLQPPVITSTRIIPGMVGLPLSYQIVATQTPTGYGITGDLPAGLSFNPATGKLSGTPTAAGTYPIILTATNASGTGSLTAKLITVANAPRFFAADYETQTIGAFTTAGDTLDSHLIKRAEGPSTVAVGGSYLYVANYYGTTVDKYTTSGQLVKSGLVDVHSPIAGIAVSGRNLYVLSFVEGLYYDTGYIYQFTLDGGPTSDYLRNPLPGYSLPGFPIRGIIDPVGFAIAEPYIYVTTAARDGSSGSVQQYTTSGATVTTSLISSLSSYPWGIAATNSTLYLTNRFTGTVSSYTTLGRLINPSLISGLNDPWGIGLSGSNLYVSDAVDGTIGAYTTTGATINTSLIPNLHTPLGIAVDPPEGEVDEQILTFPAISKHYLSDGPFTFTRPTSTSGLPVTVTVTSGPATVSGNTITPTGYGLVTLTASQAGNGSFHAAPETSVKFNIYKPKQTITFANFSAIVGTPVTMNATASSGLPITYGIQGSGATVTGNVLNPLTVSSVIVTANQVGDETIEAASLRQVIMIYGMPQMIAPFAPIPYQRSLTTLTLTIPTASSGRPVIVKVKSGPATLSGTTLTLTGSGTVVLTANLGANSTYAAAAQVTTSFGVMVRPVLAATTYSRPINVPFSIPLEASNGPTSYTMTGTLPPGVTLDSTTGILSGTATTAGTYSLNVTATNETGAATAKIKLGILENIPYIYAANYSLNTLALYSTSGVLLNPALVKGLGSPSSIGISGSYLYVFNSLTRSIATYKTTTGELVNGSLITNLHGFDFAISGSRIFAFDSDTSVSEYNTAGELVRPSFITGLPLYPHVITLSGSDLYIGTVPTVSSASVSKYTTSGTKVNDRLVSYLNGITDIAVSGSNLYVNQGNGVVSLYTTAGVLVNANLLEGNATGLFATPTSLYAAQYYTISQYSSTGTVVSNPLASGLNGSGAFTIARPVTGETPQTITLPSIANQPYGGAPIPLSSNASSGLPIDYVVTGPASIADGKLVITGAGAITVVANQGGNDVYAPAPEATAIFTVTKAPQTVTFPAVATRAFNNPATLSASSSSGLPIAYSILSGPGAITGNILTFTGLGAVTVQATQAGNADYLPAGTHIRITANKGTQSITFPPIPAQVYGAVPLSLAATASSGLPVSYAITGPATLTGSTLSISGVGTVTVKATQGGDATYNSAAAISVSFKVAKASQMVTFPAVSGRPYNSLPVALAATASSGLPITYSILSGPGTVAGNTLTFTGTGYVTVNAAQAGNANYNPAAAHIRIHATGAVSLTSNTLILLGPDAFAGLIYQPGLGRLKL